MCCPRTLTGGSGTVRCSPRPWVGPESLTTPPGGAAEVFRAFITDNAAAFDATSPGPQALFGSATSVACMDATGEGVTLPYGALVDLARDIDNGRTDAYEVADPIRSWRT